MLDDKKIVAAISNVAPRAERISSDDKLVKTYVEVGILPQLENTNNQIIYGRRGTGKTHLFRYLENSLKSRDRTIVVYIDCRTLGSAAEYVDPSTPLQRKCISLFKDIVDELCWSSMAFISETAPPDSEKALDALDQIEKATRFRSESVAVKEVTEKTTDKTASEAGGSIAIGISKAEFALSGKAGDSADVERTTKYTVTEGEKVLFPDLHNWLKNLCTFTGAQIFLLIDEWSYLPIDVQPYLAEFLKRSFLPIPQITIKVAALEYRSNFSVQRENANTLGFELGADISTNLDLDDYFVFDRNKEAITANFSEILYSHVKNELEPEYLEKNYGVKNGEDFIRTILTDSGNFKELVRASEGVIRDMLNIFSLAFYDSKRQGKGKVDKKSIVESSRQWFERDKSQNLDDKLRQALRRIVDEVIGNKRARSFLIPRELEKHETIQRLFDARVIHFITRGYADKDNPGMRYDVFGLDYGTYVDLLTTNKKPELDFVAVDERSEDDEFIVPFDDKRSIRRIVLTEDILN